MSVAKFSMQMEWKEHNVDLGALDAWMRANVGSPYCGNSADSKLTLWFTEEPTEEQKLAAQAKWDEIDASHAMAQSYKSAAELAEAAAAKKESAKAKLAALGLDSEELKAILG